MDINCTKFPINERFTKFKLLLCPIWRLIHDLSMVDNLKLVGEIHIKEKELRIKKLIN